MKISFVPLLRRGVIIQRTIAAFLSFRLLHCILVDAVVGLAKYRKRASVEEFTPTVSRGCTAHEGTRALAASIASPSAKVRRVHPDFLATHEPRIAECRKINHCFGERPSRHQLAVEVFAKRQLRRTLARRSPSINHCMFIAPPTEKKNLTSPHSF